MILGQLRVGACQAKNAALVVMELLVLLLLLLLLAAKEFLTRCDANRRKLLLATVTVTAKLSKNIRPHDCWVCIFVSVYLYLLCVFGDFETRVAQRYPIPQLLTVQVSNIRRAAILGGECINCN